MTDLVRQKVASVRRRVEGGTMPGDIDLSGFLFTSDEWLELGEDLQTELLEAATCPAQVAQMQQETPSEA